MGVLHRAVASLHITGDGLDPSEVSELLGGAPSHAYRKGDDIRMSPDRPERLARRGLWKREAAPTEPEDLNVQVIEVLQGLTSDLARWARVSNRFRAVIFCGWFMKDGNEGAEIAPSTLRLLGERGIGLALDIYGPDGDA
jgi:Domain of unknown function (DUF4279)